MRHAHAGMSGHDEYYPNTCDKCPSRGLFQYIGDFVAVEDLEPQRMPQTYFTDDGGMSNVWLFPTTKFIPVGFPDRCKACHAKSEAFRKANNTLRKLEHIRGLFNGFVFNWVDEQDSFRYLKFVTLTWRSEYQKDKPILSKRELASARLSIRRKRDKIASQLNAIAGTDVMENVIRTTWGLPDEFPMGSPVEWTKHHLHTHGIWVMPFASSKKINSVTSKYDIRDQIRAIKPQSFVDRKTGKKIEVEGWKVARRYLLKYITKIKGCKRGNWGLARGQLTEERCELVAQQLLT